MLRSVEDYIFVVVRKFSWRCRLVLGAGLYWEDHLMLSGTWRGVNWKRFVVLFHRQFNRI